MELIRPLYFVKEEDIIKWRDKNNLEFIECACKFTEDYANKKKSSKREEVKLLIKKLCEDYENVDVNIFNSVQNVNLDTIISYHKNGELHHFLDDYKRGKEWEK